MSGASDLVAVQLLLDSDTLDTGPQRIGAATLSGSAALATATGHPLGLTQALSLPGGSGSDYAEWGSIPVGRSSASFSMYDVDHEMECWVYVRAYPSTTRFAFSVQNIMDIGIGAGGTVVGNLWEINGVANALTTGAGAVPLNTWTHVRVSTQANYWAISAFSPTRAVYVNGKCVAFSTATLPASAPRYFGEYKVSVGRNHASASAGSFDGMVAQCIYRRGALTTGVAISMPAAAHANSAPGDVLLCHFDNAITDNSPSARTVTLNGGAAVQAGGGRFGGCLRVGTSKYATVPHNADQSPGSGDFTIQAWVNPVDWSVNNFPGIVSKRDSSTSGTSWSLYLRGKTGCAEFEVSGNGTTMVQAVGPRLRQGAWNHVAAQRKGDTLQVFVNGEAGATVAFTGSVFASTSGLIIGRLATSEAGSHYWADAYLDDVRVTMGAALYTDATPAPSSTPAGPIPPATATLSKVVAKLSQAAMPLSASLKAMAPCLLLGDYWRGGKGRIASTVTVDIDPTPVDPPLRRRVLLVREDTGEAIRQTWSDATTGAYEFRDLDMRVKYTVVAHDYQGNYRAAIASGLTPTAMF